MELYLIRHGIAVDRKPDIQDEERLLTAEGRERTRKVAKRLYGLGLRFDLILTSPLVRSRQTAEILHEGKLSNKIESSGYLAPQGNIHDWLNELEQQQMLATDTKLAMVGHEPDLGQWASILVWGEARNVLVLKKAGIIGLKLPKIGSPVGGSQLFLLTPPKFVV